jgi:IclR family transcriptional regulator, KDG regulon repressor
LHKPALQRKRAVSIELNKNKRAIEPTMAINKSMRQAFQNKTRTNESYGYIVPAVDRAARILRLLREKARSMTIAEVAEATGWHKSSVHKLLVTLNHHGFLDRNEETKQYSLGITLIEYGQFVLKKLDVAAAVKTLLKELAEYSGETVNYCIRRGMQMVVADSIESRIELRVVPPIGTMNLITEKSSGKAALAFLPENEANAIIRAAEFPAFTKNSITNRDGFSKELAEIRKLGYATDFEEFREGVSAISAPVFNSMGEVVGTLSLVAPASRFTKDKVSHLGKKCAETAAKLSAMIR